MSALSRRAIACKYWRWMPGMKIRSIDKVCILVSSEGEPIYRDGYGVLTSVPYAEPDLDDPGTLGYLEEAVRSAYKGLVVTSRGSGWWRVETDAALWDDDCTKSFPEALLKALEVAE